MENICATRTKADSQRDLSLTTTAFSQTILICHFGLLHGKEPRISLKNCKRSQTVNGMHSVPSRLGAMRFDDLQSEQTTGSHGGVFRVVLPSLNQTAACPFVWREGTEQNGRIRHVNTANIACDFPHVSPQEPYIPRYLFLAVDVCH